MKTDQKLNGAFLPVDAGMKMALAVKQSRLRLGGPDTIMNA